jgi:hypothetical protein
VFLEGFAALLIELPREPHDDQMAKLTPVQVLGLVECSETLVERPRKKSAAESSKKA